MINVYVMSVSLLEEPELFTRALSKVDSERREKVAQAKRQKDKMLSLGAGLLLQYALQKHLADDRHRVAGSSAFPSAGEVAAEELPAGEMPAGELSVEEVSVATLMASQRSETTAQPIELTYCYGPHGKPYLSQYSELYFSLSHSGEYVLCALADREIGADIQQVRPKETFSVREKHIGEKFFSSEEQKWLLTAADEAEKKQRFYRLWAAREAYLKLTGRGLSQAMDSFSVDLQAGTVRSTCGAGPGKNCLAVDEIGVGTAQIRLLELAVPAGYEAAVCMYGE